MLSYAFAIFVLNMAQSLISSTYSYQMQRLATNQRLGLMHGA